MEQMPQIARDVLLEAAKQSLMKSFQLLYAYSNEGESLESSPESRRVSPPRNSPSRSPKASPCWRCSPVWTPCCTPHRGKSPSFSRKCSGGVPRQRRRAPDGQPGAQPRNPRPVSGEAEVVDDLL